MHVYFVVFVKNHGSSATLKVMCRNVAIETMGSRLTYLHEPHTHTKHKLIAVNKKIKCHQMDLN